MTKRMIGVIMVLTMVLLCFSIPANALSPAPERYQSGEIYYRTNWTNYAWLSGFATDKATVVLPKTIDGYNILEMESMLEISDKTSHIKVADDNLMFEDIDGIVYDESRTILRRVPVGRSGHITIPEGVEQISECALYECKKVTSVTLPKSLKEIGSSAFWGCTSLKKITIPENVESIGRSCFDQCNSLEEIQFINEDFECQYNMFGDIPYTRNICKWENGACYMGDHLVKTNDQLPADFVIKEGTRVIEENVISYAQRARLQTVYIPDSVEEIQWNAFSQCINLREIRMPEKGCNIEDGAFYSTAYYENASNWQDGQLYIGNHLIFAGPNDLVRDGTLSIAGGALKSKQIYSNLRIPKSVTHISENLRGFQAEVYNIILYLGNDHFQVIDGVLYRKADHTLLLAPCGITEVNVLAGTKTIASVAFQGCKELERITLPNSLETIQSYAFAECSKLEQIQLPDSLKIMDENAFYQAGAIKNLTIPQNLKNGFGFSSLNQIETLKYSHGVQRMELVGSVYKLKTIDVPYTVRAISADFFHGDFTLLVASNSFALEFAKAYNIPYQINKEGPKPVESKPQPKPTASSKAESQVSVPSVVTPVESNVTPTDVPTDTPTDTATDTPTDRSGVGGGWIWFAVGGVALLAVGGAGWLFIKKKKS